LKKKDLILGGQAIRPNFHVKAHGLVVFLFFDASRCE